MEDLENRLKESPHYVRLSLAAAMTLGFLPGLFYRHAKLYCINLLLTYADGCRGSCAYCGLSKSRSGKFVEKSFIRVEWPIYELGEVIGRMEERREEIKRICISMITNRRAPRDLIKVVQAIRAKLDIPLSLLITPTILKEKDLLQFKESGADRVGIAIDAATPELFEKYRGKYVKGPHRWEKYWDTLKRAVKIFGYDKVGSHLIVGLGETEKEMVEIIQRVRDLGGKSHLFSFFPEEDSQLENHPQPPIGQYRRIQLARYLIDEEIITFKDITFDERDRIVDFGLSYDRLLNIIDSGLPFMTSGCPGREGKVACNRPYADSPPGPNIRNYPFYPQEEDIKQIKEQLWEYNGARHL